MRKLLAMTVVAMLTSTTLVASAFSQPPPRWQYGWWDRGPHGHWRWRGGWGPHGRWVRHGHNWVYRYR